MTNALNTIAQDGAVQFEHQMIESESLFFRDDDKNSDKEYHAQLVQVSEDKYNVMYQYGKRGANLVTGEVFDGPVGRWTANRNYQDLVASKRKKGYAPIDMSRLNEVYQQMTQMGMDSAGFDLFMSARGKVISLAEYFRKNKSSSSGEYSFVASYEAARAIGTMLAGVGMAAVNEKEVARSAGLVAAKLSQMGLNRANIFLGRQEDDVVEPYYDSDRHMLMAPVKQKKASKP